MSLLLETSIISACILLLSLVPLFLPVARRYSKFFYLLGTGALSGILAFDLIPDLFDIGGSKSLIGVAAVWFLYSLLHMSHLGHHGKKSVAGAHDQHDDDAHEHHHHGSGGNTYVFLGSMVAHCIASGVMLVAAPGLGDGFNRTVFWALLAHKAYEALTVSSVLIEKEHSRLRTVVSVLVYSASLPLGVVLTYGFRTALTPFVAMLITSLAAGTLMGCLIFDFLIPSISQMKNRKTEIGWILVGLGITQVMMRML